MGTYCSFLSLCCVRLFVTPMDCSPPGSPVHGILQARMLEWVAIPFSRGSSRPRERTCVSCTGRQMLYHLSQQKSPRTLERVAYPFSRGSYRPRDRTGVFHIAGRFFTAEPPLKIKIVFVYRKIFKSNKLKRKTFVKVGEKNAEGFGPGRE